MADAETLLADACSDDISTLSLTQLWIVIAEALAQQVSMTAEELLDAACADGISALSETQLLVAIAEGINQGGGGGGGGGGATSGNVDPVAPPANPAVDNVYFNIANLNAITEWLWPAGGGAWSQVV